MEIEYQYTKEDFIQANKTYCAYNLSKRITLIIVLCLIIPAFSSGDHSFSFIKYLIGVVACFAIFLSLGYFLPLLIGFIRMRRLLKEDKTFFEKRELTVTDEGLSIEHEGKINVREWVSITTAMSVKKFIYVKLVDKSLMFFPDRFFASHADKLNFLGLVQSKLSHLSPNIRFYKPSKPSYFLGLLCLIPVVGLVTGIIFFVNGLSKYKDKWFAIIGLGGIAWTILFALIVAKPIDHGLREAFKPHAQWALNDAIKNIEFYKLKHGTYPDSLGQLRKEGTIVLIDDPIQTASLFSGSKPILFNYKLIGNHYYLFSSGVDGIPGTADDIYPQVSQTDSGKFGLVIPKQCR